MHWWEFGSMIIFHRSKLQYEKPSSSYCILCDVISGGGGGGVLPYICYTGTCRWIGYVFQGSLPWTGFTIRVFVSWTGYLFPGIPDESSWLGLHEPVCDETLKHVSEHGIMFKALYWYLSSSLEQGPKSKRIFLNRVSYFLDYSLKQGQGFTVSAAHPHSITYRVPPPGVIFVVRLQRNSKLIILGSERVFKNSLCGGGGGGVWILLRRKASFLTCFIQFITFKVVVITQIFNSFVLLWAKVVIITPPLCILALFCDIWEASIPREALLLPGGNSSFTVFGWILPVPTHSVLVKQVLFPHIIELPHQQRLAFGSTWWCWPPHISSSMWSWCWRCLFRVRRVRHQLGWYGDTLCLSGGFQKQGSRFRPGQSRGRLCTWNLHSVQAVDNCPVKFWQAGVPRMHPKTNGFIGQVDGRASIFHSSTSHINKKWRGLHISYRYPTGNSPTSLLVAIPMTDLSGVKFSQIKD